MKKLITYCLLLLNLTVIGQTTPKERYINNSDYLSKNSLTDYKSYYGDSLQGFDEASMKVELLRRNVFGSEYINYIALVKREWVNQKYGIKPLLPINSNNRPVGGPNVVNSPGNACVNEDFELTAPGAYNGMNSVLGWTIQSGQNTSGICCGNPTYGAGCVANPIANWNAGSPEFSIVATPILPAPSCANPPGFSIDNVTIPNSPLGGNRVARLQNSCPTGLMTRMMTQFPVSNSNTLFQFCYAGSWDGVHECCGQPAFRIDMYNCTGSLIPIPCANVSLTPSGQSCQSGVPGYQVTNGVSWVNWQTKYIDLTPYIGQCIRIVVTCSDCSYSGHHGTAYFDARCGGQLVGVGLGGVGGNIAGPVSYCAGSNQAIIAAPLGYSSYQWISPITGTIPANAGGTAPTLTVSPVIAGAVYTVQLNSPSGCSYIATNTIMPTLVNIAGIGSATSCAGGSSGSGTVQGNGSGTGYNYTWVNSNNAVVGTSATVSGLLPGTYSITITGLGNAGCGSATSTISIGVGIPQMQNLLKPYCGGQAYLSVTGNNVQWSTNNTPISAPLGVAMGYTVNNPVQASVYTVTYTSLQGCNESASYTLISSPPGNISLLTTSVCLNSSNGSGTINLTPASGSPPGANSYSVWNSNNTPAYNSSLAPTNQNSYLFGNMGTGSYQVRVFDGSCAYTTSFNILTHVFSPTLSPTSTTLCPGGGIAAGIVFSIPPSFSQYTYSWTPNIFLAGNTQQSTILIPNLAVGTQSNITYSVVITPTAINCPITLTLNLLAINPPTPTLSIIPSLCNNSSPYQIIALPGGGVFTGVGVGTLGVISPTAIGVNTYTYAISISTCAASNTSSYEVSYFNTSALTGSINNLCVTNSPVNLMGIVQNTTGVWSGVGVTSGSFSPLGLNTSIYSITYNTTSTPNPTVCPSSTQLNISVTNTIIPTMTNAGPFCNNTSSFVLSANPSGGTWSNNSAVSSLGIVTPSLSSPSNSIVGYMVTVGPCINTNTFSIYPSTYNTASLTGVVPNMCVTNNAFNLMSIVQNTTGTWSGMNVNQSLFNPAGLGTNSYVLTYNTNSTPNTTICPDSRTINVSVLNPPMPNITSVGPICSLDALIQMSVAPSTGSWITAPYINLNGVLNPSLCSIGNNVIQYVIGTNTCSSQQTKTITVEVFVPSTITNQIPDMCNTSSAVNLSMYATFPGSWVGFGVSGSMFNPNASGAGTITLIHNTSSTSGLCPSTSTTSVRVYSLAAPSITKSNTICNTHSPFQLLVTPIGGLFGSNSGVSLSGLFTPAYASVGNNVINYSITSGPCIAYGQTTITVEKFISADITQYPNSVYCKGTAQPFNLKSFVINTNGTWSGPGVIGSMFNPNIANIGNNIVHYLTTSTTASLCPDTSDLKIVVANTPTISIIANKLNGCTPFTNILSIDKNSGTAEWIFNKGVKSKQGLSTSQTFTNAGLYNVYVNYINVEGCATTFTSVPTFTVYEKPIAKFSIPSVISIAEPQIQIENQTIPINDNYYNWSILNTQYTELNPVINFTKPGKYEVYLMVTSFDGCKDTLRKVIEVKGTYNVWIPSSFTPNFDKVNDVFIPVFSPFGIDAKYYEFTIFNRWGALLFNTTNIHTGWDGTYKGEPVIEGVYVFTLKFKDADGVVYDKIGHVTLLR